MVSVERWGRRGVEVAGDAAGAVARRWAGYADPRNRMMRRRRWTLRFGVLFAAATAFYLGVTALLAVWDTPPWALAISGSLAAVSAFPATLLLLRFSWLRREPLPAPRPGAARRLPPSASRARAPMAALESAERGLFAMLGVVERGGALSADAIADVADVARRCAAAMAATADEVVALEREAGRTARSRAHLDPTIGAFVTQLDAGLAQYHEMLDATAALVASVNGTSGAASPLQRRRARHELGDATDRLIGWAHAYDDLRPLRRA